MTMTSKTHGDDQREIWKDLALKALKADDLTRLNRITEDGITIQPLYLAEDRQDALSDTVSAQSAQGWKMVQYVEPAHDASQLNRGILDELEGGASGIILTPDQDLSLITHAMDGVYLDAISVELNAPQDAVAAANILAGLWRDHNITPDDAKGAIGVDGLASVVLAKAEFDADAYGQSLKAVMDIAGDWPHLSVVSIGGVKWHNLGLTPAQQIAASMAETVMVLRAAETQGIDLDAMVGAMRFGLVFDADLYQGLAKARAFKAVLIKLLAAMDVNKSLLSGLSNQCHGYTAEAMLSRLDTDTNILRNGTAMLAASLSGFGHITAMPHNWLTGSTDQGRRIARNMHHLLADESQLGRVADPAQGSYFMDVLAAELAEKSWGLFQEIENAGGIVKAWGQGLITAWADQASDARQSRLNKGEVASLGTTLHPIKGADLLPVVDGVLGPRGGINRSTQKWEDLYGRFKGQSLRCLLLDIGMPEESSKNQSAAQFSRWFAAVGLDGTVMTADDLSHGQSILSSAKPDVLILGGALAATLAEDPIFETIKPAFTMAANAVSDAGGDFYQVMVRIADAIQGGHNE